MILGTLPAPTPNLSGSDSAALFYTNPSNALVQLNDTYSTFVIVKHGDCSMNASDHKRGYNRVELGVGGKLAIYSRDTLTQNQWNITATMKEEEYVSDHGIYVVKMNITFDNTTINGIWRELTEGNKTPISIRFIYTYYNYTVENKQPSQRTVSSSRAFISIKDPNNDDEVGGSSGEDNGIHTHSEGGNTTTDSTQEPASSGGLMTSNVNEKNEKQSNAVSSSLRLCTVAEFPIFCSLIVLSFSV